MEVVTDESQTIYVCQLCGVNAESFDTMSQHVLTCCNNFPEAPDNITLGDQIEAGTSKNKMIWTEHAAKKLLDSVEIHISELSDKASKKNKIWDVIAQNLREEHGLDCTGHQCNDKYKGMVRVFKNYKQALTRTGAATPKCLFYFNALERIIGNSHSVSVPYLLDSGSNVTTKQNTAVPASSVPHKAYPLLLKATPLPPSATLMLPMASPVPPMATPMLPMASHVPPMATPMPSMATSMPSMASPVLPMASPVLPMASPVLPMASPVLPMATPVLPIATPVLPIATPVLPTALPTAADMLGPAERPPTPVANEEQADIPEDDFLGLPDAPRAPAARRPRTLRPQTQAMLLQRYIENQEIHNRKMQEKWEKEAEDRENFMRESTAQRALLINAIDRLSNAIESNQNKQ